MAGKFYKRLDFMEQDLDGHKYIFGSINPGDYTREGDYKLTVTQEAIDCDCGKGMYCPFIIQEKA